MIDNICGKHYSGIILLNQLFSINILKIVHHVVNKKQEIGSQFAKPRT